MSQTFELCIATETIATDAQQLGVSVNELKCIYVYVTAKVVQQPSVSLQLTYHVSLPNQVLATQLDWPIWQSDQVGFCDYLWERSCLECFVTGGPADDTDFIDHTNSQPPASYIEINASPDGRYALYQFKSYRNPATLPPTPLYQANGYTLASIEWPTQLQPKTSVENHLPNEIASLVKPYYYERSFNIAITQSCAATPQYAISNTVIEQIHPCVILWLGTTPLYFAVSHASPPDFHNSNHWSKFALESS